MNLNCRSFRISILRKRRGNNDNNNNSMCYLFSENTDLEQRRKITEALTSIRKDLVSDADRTHLKIKGIVRIASGLLIISRKIGLFRVSSKNRLDGSWCYSISFKNL